MAEIVVQFSNQRNGYDKAEVNQFVKDAETKLQEKALALATTQQQVTELEARLAKLTAGDLAVEEKAVLYDKLMQKMDGDYENLLRPAIVKAKAIEEKAKMEYEIRMDQARITADGIYNATAKRIARVVDSNMDRVYGLMDQFVYSKTLPGRVQSFVRDCNYVSTKIAEGLFVVGKVSGNTYDKLKASCKDMKDRVQGKVRAEVGKRKDTITTTINLFR